MRRLAAIVMQAEQLETRMVNGEQIDQSALHPLATRRLKREGMGARNGAKESHDDAG